MISSSDILNASILIVDDQEANVALLEQMLRGAGYVSIFITASKDPDLLEKVTELGAAGLFEKPLDTEKLLSSIAVHLNA